MSNLVEKYGKLPLKKNARTVTSRVTPKTIDHPAYGRVFNAYNTRYVELDGGAITLELARERENAPNYPFADGMRFCSEHTRDSDVIQVIECRNCYAITPVRDLQTIAALDPFRAAVPCWNQVITAEMSICAHLSVTIRQAHDLIWNALTHLARTRSEPWQVKEYTLAYDVLEPLRRDLIKELRAIPEKAVYDAGNHNGMPCEWTAFGDSAKGVN